MINHFGRMAGIALVVGIASATAAQAQGKWRSGAPIPQGANEVIGAAVGGQIYVYGGQDATMTPQGLFFKYDPAKDQWTKLASNPVAVHHSSAVGIGRKLYVIGGFRLPTTGKVGWYPENKAWAYDIDSGQWSALPPMPTARGALAAVAVGKKIYVNGGGGIPAGTDMPDGIIGGGPQELYATMEVFDTETNKWSTLAPMLTPRNHHSMAAVDGKIYSIGGRVGSCFSNGWGTNVWMNEEYDIAANIWRVRAPMPTARSGTAIGVSNGKIYVLGGEGWVDEFGGVFRANEVYDPKTNTWSRAARMLTPRHGFAAAEIGPVIYAVSGVNNAGGAGAASVVAVNEIFEP
jgi:N-acetylneuraminic acid mutarotase